MTSAVKPYHISLTLHLVQWYSACQGTLEISTYQILRLLSANHMGGSYIKF